MLHKVLSCWGKGKVKAEEAALEPPIECLAIRCSAADTNSKNEVSLGEGAQWMHEIGGKGRLTNRPQSTDQIPYAKMHRRAGRPQIGGRHVPDHDGSGRSPHLAQSEAEEQERKRLCAVRCQKIAHKYWACSYSGPYTMHCLVHCKTSANNC